MTEFIRSIAILLMSTCLVQGAWAQFNVSGPGFLPDENGINLDDPQAKKGTPKVAAGSVIKDCAKCPEMVVIPAGSFYMGSEKNSEEKPQHLVQIQTFAIGKYEVTGDQWFAVMGYDPSAKRGRNLPVEQVSWGDVQRFITFLNRKTGQKYRLPSESEWEYAARAGTDTEWSFGNDESKSGNYAWHDRNSEGKTQTVGQKLPNEFGLFDMHGNVWEWVQDCRHETYAGAPADGSAWTTGCSSNRRVRRGGTWVITPTSVRSASRGSFSPDVGSSFGGFRLARDL